MLKRVLDIIDEQGVNGLVKTGMKRTLPFRNKVRWGICSRQKRYSGITDVKRERKVIVSLTSFPARIDTVYITIKSILMQSLKPDLIILWLAHEQFPQKENELPRNLLELKKYGLAIEWCYDIKSYKKLQEDIPEEEKAKILFEMLFPEKEERKPSLEVLVKLSEIFNCSIDYILCKSNIRNPIPEI